MTRLLALLLGLCVYPNFVYAETHPSAVLNEARRFAAEGRYAEALEKHIWFHENALSRNPHLAGVRLSFALRDWVSLAERYPPAGDALRQIRDDLEKELKQGTGTYHSFVDVSAINRTLGEAGRTIALFKQLDRDNPELAGQVYRVVRNGLVEAGEHELARKYVGDPDVALAALRDRFQQNLQMARENPQLNTESFHTFREHSFRRDLADLVEILVATGAEDEARRLFEAARGISEQENPLREAVREAVDRGRNALAADGAGLR